ncbi:MAG TPA: POTRA domain-containing protein, partial [Allosphingosinicella sp.]
MTANKPVSTRRRLFAALLVGTVLSGTAAVPAAAQRTSQSPARQQQQQQRPQPAPTPPPVIVPAPEPASNDPTARTIRTLRVTGSQRLEPETVVAYSGLRAGQSYNQETLDEALRQMLATELFADVQISGVASGDIELQVRENPVINRIVLEGNRRIKEDKITPEIRLAPRQIFTRSRARADVARIVELYRRQGRFGATVEPQIIQLDQNR